MGCDVTVKRVASSLFISDLTRFRHPPSSFSLPLYNTGFDDSDSCLPEAGRGWRSVNCKNGRATRMRRSLSLSVRDQLLHFTKGNTKLRLILFPFANSIVSFPSSPQSDQLKTLSMSSTTTPRGKSSSLLTRRSPTRSSGRQRRFTVIRI